MRNSILAIAVSIFLVNSVCSQSKPKPPKTPKTTSTKKGTSYSITFDTDDKEENSSVSIKRNDDIYKFSARFHENKVGSIKRILVDKLGNSNLTVSGDTYRWIKKDNEEKLYDCKLTDNNLKIYVDKEYASSKLVDFMDNLGVVLKDAISGSDSEKEEKERAEADLKRAQNDLKRAKRNLERVKKNLKDS